MEKAAANPPAASHMKREDDSYAKPLMSCACAASRN